MILQDFRSHHSLEIYAAIAESAVEIPIISSGISAGFPSPAMDFIDLTIDMNKHLIYASPQF